MKIAVIGATGFVGRALVARLAADGYEAIPVVRAPADLPGERVVGAIEAVGEWHNQLDGADVVINLAARVHMMRDAAVDPLAEYRRVNSEAALAMAIGAHRAGIRRYIYLSSIKVNGEDTNGRAPFTADEPVSPSDPYARSKREAERNLLDLAGSTGMEVVIIRPPLVYGPGVKANFQAMMKWLRTGLPLPLGAVRNSRSLVGLDNLIDLVTTCIRHPDAANQVFLVSDGEDVSTPQLLRMLGSALGSAPRLLPVPPSLVVSAAKLVGKGAAVQRLLGDLKVDISKTRETLDWAPRVPLQQGLNATAIAYLKSV